MNIESVHIRNFRKLKNCHIDFGEKETVFVGANNSGKTSAISAIVWFLKNTERFTLSLPQEVVIFAHAYTDTLTPADSTKAANTPKSFLFAFIYVDNHFNAPNMHFLEQQRC